MMKSAVASLLFMDYASASASSWDYDQMATWSNEFSMCGVEHQSPIDVRPYEAVFDKEICDATFGWDVDFTKQTFKIANNGHALVLKPVQQTDIDPDLDLETSLLDEDGLEYGTLSGSDNTIARLPNYFKPDGSDHDTFCLDSFHFHWGVNDESGSEHLLDGYQYPLEVHFVHYSCSHSSLGSTLEQFPTMEAVADADDEGTDIHQLGVVGIFFDVVDDRTNPAFDVILNNATLESIMFPAEDHSGHTIAEIVHDLDLEELIPEEVWSDGYYAYEGSLTTPPCTDIVRWHVMNARGYIGRSQMEMFRELMSTEEYAIAPNFREVQANPSTVYGCTGEEEEGSEDSDSSELSWWAIAIISSLATAIVMGFIFLFIYKKQEREMDANLDYTSKTEMEKKRTSSDMWTTR